MAITPLPEVTGHTSLLQAIDVVRNTAMAHAEDLHAIAARTVITAAVSAQLSDQMADARDPDGGKIDDQSVAEVREIAAAADLAAKAGTAYRDAAQDTAGAAVHAHRTAVAVHGAYKEARDASTVEAPTRGFLAPR